LFQSLDNLVYLRNYLPGYEYGPAISIVLISHHYMDSTVTRGNARVTDS